MKRLFAVWRIWKKWKTQERNKMAEPTSALGFYDLLLRVAEKVGVAYYGSDGQGIALVPVDAFNLDRIKRVINDGFRLFVASSPVRGWHWQERTASITLTPTASGIATSEDTSTTLIDTTNRDEADDYFNTWILTITGGTGVGETATITDFDQGTSKLTFSAGLSGSTTPDATSVYRLEPAAILLPEDFSGEADGPIEYAASTNNGTPIDWVSEATIRAHRANFVTTGYPSKAAIAPYQPTAGVLGTARRWQLLVDPSPVAAHTVQFPYTSYFNKMDCEAGTATAGGATSLSDSTRAEADDYFNGWILTIIAGVGLGQTATITDYTGSTGKFDFTALSGGSTPTTTSVYYVEPAANLHPAGFKFDNVVNSACLAEAEKQFEEINEGAVELFYKVDLPLAHKADGLSRPRKLRLRRTRDRYSSDYNRTWFDVTTDNDL